MDMEEDTTSDKFFLGAALWMTRDNFQFLKNRHTPFMKTSKITAKPLDSKIKLTGSAAAICALYNLVKGTIAEENGASAEGSPPDQTPEEEVQRNTMEQRSQAECAGYPTDSKAKKTSTFTMSANGGKAGQKERHPAENKSGQAARSHRDQESEDGVTHRAAGTRTTAEEEPRSPQLPENHSGSSEKTHRSNSHNPSEVRESATWADRNDLHHGDATRTPRPANRHDLRREGDAAQQIALEKTDIEEGAEVNNGSTINAKSGNDYMDPITSGRNSNQGKGSRRGQDSGEEGRLPGSTKPSTDQLSEEENRNPTSGARAKIRERIQADSGTKSAMAPKDEKRVRKIKNVGVANNSTFQNDQPNHQSKYSPRSAGSMMNYTTPTTTGHEQNKVLLQQQNIRPSASREESRSEVITVTMETFVWMWIKGKYENEVWKRKKQCEVIDIKEKIIEENNITIYVRFPPDTHPGKIDMFNKEILNLKGTADLKGISGFVVPPHTDIWNTELIKSVKVNGEDGQMYIVGPDAAEIEEIKTLIEIRGKHSSGSTKNDQAVSAGDASASGQEGTVFIEKDIWGYLTLPNKHYITKLKNDYELTALSDDMKGNFIEVKLTGPKDNVKSAISELSKLSLRYSDDLRFEALNLKKCEKKKDLHTAMARCSSMYSDVYMYVEDDMLKIVGTGEDVHEAKRFLMEVLGAKPTRVRKMAKEKGSDPIRGAAAAPTPEPTVTHADVSYKTANGHKIHIFQGDITKLNVYGIVNAANERLHHAGGVAWAISKAAGPKLQQRCNDMMRGRKDLRLSQAIATEGYNLPCKYVIHVVGPRWDFYNRHQKGYCADHLREAFINALTEANGYGCSSVAVPAISSGIYGVPLDVVVEQMYNAVIDFTIMRPNSLLRDIILTDISSDTVSTIKRKFYKEVKVTQTAPLETIASEAYKFLGRTATVTSSITSREGGAITHQPQSYSGAVKGGTQPRSSQGFSQTSEVKDLTRGSESRSDRGQKGRTGKEAWADEPAASTGSQGQIGAYGGAVGQSQGQIQGQASEQEEVTCSICMDAVTDCKTLACKHTFCKECIDAWFQNKPTCPQCGKVYGKLTGNQPKGTMEDKIIGEPLPGYRCPTIEINYSFPSGRQGPEHPNPGKRYQGTRRTAYLPNNKAGKEVLRMLREAFDARLTFTIGRSTTTGAEDQITWNDIHHKTHMTGGPERFGYPDITYLERVKSELADKGIK